MPIFCHYDKKRSEILMYNVILLYETNFQTKWNIAFIFRFFFKFGFHLHVLTCVSFVILNNNISCQQYAYASVPISEQKLLDWFSKLKMRRRDAFPNLWGMSIRKYDFETSIILNHLNTTTNCRFENNFLYIKICTFNLYTLLSNVSHWFIWIIFHFQHYWRIIYASNNFLIPNIISKIYKHITA